MALTLRAGQEFVGNSQPYISPWFKNYQLVRPNGKSERVVGVDGDDPAGGFVAGGAGLYLVGYQSHRDYVEVAPRIFHKYLAMEGLEFIEPRRAKAGESELPGREFYSRCAKSLLWVGGGKAAAARAGGYDRLLGYTLELVPGKNPYGLTPGDPLPLQLLFQGQPLEGALLIAFTREQPQHKLQARTNAQGRAALKLPHPGVWLIKAVHMVDAPPGEKARWESFWASLTFELPPG